MENPIFPGGGGTPGPPSCAAPAARVRSVTQRARAACCCAARYYNCALTLWNLPCPFEWLAKALVCVFHIMCVVCGGFSKLYWKCNQYLSSLFLKVFRVGAKITSFGNKFHGFTTLMGKKCLPICSLWNRCFSSFRWCPLVLTLLFLLIFSSPSFVLYFSVNSWQCE